MMGVAQGLSALLHKGSLEGISSLSLDLSGLYDESKRPIYSNPKGEAMTPPHKYGDSSAVAVMPDMASYAREIGGFLQDFSRDHLGGIPVEVGYDKVANKVAEKTGIASVDLKESYKKPDGTSRVDASAIAADYNNGSMRGAVKDFGSARAGAGSHEILGEHTARVVAKESESHKRERPSSPVTTSFTEAVAAKKPNEGQTH